MLQSDLKTTNVSIPFVKVRNTNRDTYFCDASKLYEIWGCREKEKQFYSDIKSYCLHHKELLGNKIKFSTSLDEGEALNKLWVHTNSR